MNVMSAWCQTVDTISAEVDITNAFQSYIYVYWIKTKTIKPILVIRMTTAHMIRLSSPTSIIVGICTATRINYITLKHAQLPHTWIKSWYQNILGHVAQLIHIFDGRIVPKVRCGIIRLLRLSWFESYLKDRTQTIQIGSCTSICTCHIEIWGSSGFCTWPYHIYYGHNPSWEYYCKTCVEFSSLRGRYSVVYFLPTRCISIKGDSNNLSWGLYQRYKDMDDQQSFET